VSDLGFTGAIYGPAAFNPGDNQGVRQVFIYHRGDCPTGT